MAFDDVIKNPNWSIKKKAFVNDTRIRYGIYTPPSTAAKRFVIFINGHGEYIEKYSFLPEDLELPPEWGFVTWDHRGQGDSEGSPRLHFDDYDLVCQDGESLLQDTIGDSPYSVIAHSMGGLIALYGTMRGFFKPEKIVLSAPLFGVQTAIPTCVARAMSFSAVSLGMGRTYFQNQLDKNPAFENNMFTYSRERFHRRCASPYRFEGVTFGWIRATLKAIDYVSADNNLAKLQTDIKVLIGDDERLVDTTAIDKWCEKAQSSSSSNIDIVRLQDTRHEILNEAPKSYAKALNVIKTFVF